MDSFAEELDNFLHMAHDAAERLSEDERLDPRYAAQEAQKLWQDAVAEARRLAAEKLAELQKRRDVSSEKLAKEAAALDAMLEPERQSAAIMATLAQVDAFDTWENFERVIGRAVTMDDRHALTAWADVGLPALEKRLPSVPRLKEKPGELARLKELVSKALTKLEPATLRKARQEAQEAEAAYETLQSDLDRINERWSRTHGGRGPLADPDGIKITMHERDGKMIFTAKGRWP